ncbi:MAG: hypothetical protein K6F09_07575 [Clostridiales bacterium]|nr:hypothetical protein [Clostridiales bacterium]
MKNSEKNYKTDYKNASSAVTDMADSVTYAAKNKNLAQAVYTDNRKTAYRMSDENAVLTHTLKSGKTLTLSDKNGNVYIKNSFDVYYRGADGKKHYASSSARSARMNTVKFGEYYYDCRIRDLDFCETLVEKPVFLLDKGFHVYSDRIYEELTLLAAEATEELCEFGSEIKIPVSSVKAVSVADKNGVHDSFDGVDPESVEYVAFDVRKAGVAGIIIPSDGSTGSVTLMKRGKNYLVDVKANYKSGTGINKYDETGDRDLPGVTFGFRIYSDDTHSFDGIKKEAYIERHPLENITVSRNDSGARFTGYNAILGAYTFAVNGSDFNLAYYYEPDVHFKVPMTVKCDDRDRNIYIRCETESGCLEAGAVLDKNDLLMPIDVEVCKNFCGDFGEPKPYYYTFKDRAYGVSVFPLSLKSNSETGLTLLNLYQNWGKYPLKQLSSIEFGDPYYHLSTGVTESNCIAPYLLGDIGWLLPDFRGRSGTMWSGQPQFNSLGELGFMRRKNLLFGAIERNNAISQYSGSEIRSSGLTYSDILLDYTADNGAFDYTLRHFEFPQTDENRTYYSVDVKFNRDVSFADFKRTCALFWINGRFVDFNKMGYLDADNKCAVKDVKASFKTTYCDLGSENPYFDFFDVTEETEHFIDECFGSSFALFVSDLKATQNGKETPFALTLKEYSVGGKAEVALTLKEGSVKFKKGDTIHLDLILLPWGTGREKNDESVRKLRLDSVINKTEVTASVGKDVSYGPLPEIYAENNEAEFSLKGGLNNITVRVDGFKDASCPEIKLNGEEYDLASGNGYDGYTVHYNPDGTYGFSFVYTSESPETEYTFSLKQ